VETPDPGVQLQGIPEANQPGLNKLPALSLWERSLIFHEVEICPGPGCTWLGLGDDQHRAGHHGGVADKRGVIIGLQPAGVAEEQPQPLARGGPGRPLNHRVRPLKEEKVGPLSVDGGPGGGRLVKGTDCGKPLGGEAIKDGLEVRRLSGLEELPP